MIKKKKTEIHNIIYVIHLIKKYYFSTAVFKEAM